MREQQVNRNGILLTNYVMEKDMDRKEEKIQCIFSEQNEQCIKERCPFHKKEKKKAAFICVHNSCRSQIAEALGKHFASDVFESYSAGTETKEQINQDAVRLMKKRYGIDMEETQYSKLIRFLSQILRYPWAVMWNVLLLEDPLTRTGDLRIRQERAMLSLKRL